MEKWLGLSATIWAGRLPPFWGIRGVHLHLRVSRFKQVVQQEAAVNSQPASHRVACLIICVLLKAAQAIVPLEASAILLQFCFPLEGGPRDRGGGY